MGRVLVHIQSHLDEPMPLDQLAEVASFSPWHFHRIFRGMVGESVKEHVRRLRLERAAQQLRDTNRAVVDIALEAGYETHESFTRAFAAMFGPRRRSSATGRRHKEASPSQPGRRWRSPFVTFLERAWPSCGMLVRSIRLAPRGRSS